MLVEVPAEVLEVIKELKKKHKHNISVKKIKGKLYIYEQTTKRSVAGNIVSYTLYLGRIDENNRFIEAKHRKTETSTYSLDESIKLKEKRSLETKPYDLIHPDNTDIEILKSLSANGRASVSEISRKIGLSNASTKYRIKRLEEKYSLKYTLQFAPRPFGFFRYIILVRFSRDKPDSEKMKQILEKDPCIQTAVFTKGRYDLFIYLLAENTKVLEDKIYDLRTSEVFAQYPAYWYVNYITDAYGFIPIREKFFDLLKERIWKRTKDSPRKLPNQLLEREYHVLKELTLNSNINFTQLDTKLGLGKGMSLYTYSKLLESKIIISPTITLQQPQIKYLGFIYCLQLDFQKYKGTRKYSLMNLLEDTNNPTNKYVLAGDIGSPYGFLRIAPIYDDGGLEKIEEQMSTTVKGLKIRSFIGTDVAVGTLGYRKLEAKHTRQYKMITEYNEAKA